MLKSEENKYIDEHLQIPYLDKNRWVVKYYDKTKIKKREFILQSSAWNFYFQIFNQLKYEFSQGKRR